MARAKSYDRDEALSKAMHAFWDKGFAGTSMRALTKATGVSPKSLYAEFGDKETLFLSALDAYIQEQAAFYKGLEGSPFGLERLYQHFACDFDETFKGCFLINSLSEGPNVPADAQQRIDDFFRYVHDLYFKHLEAAQTAKDLREDLDLHASAEALVVFDQGLAIAGMSSVQRPLLKSAAKAFLDGLARS